MYYKDIKALNSQLEKTESGSIDFHKSVDLILPRKVSTWAYLSCALALCLMPPSSGQYKVGLLGDLGVPVIHSDSH